MSNYEIMRITKIDITPNGDWDIYLEGELMENAEDEKHVPNGEPEYTGRAS